ncbi:MAG: LamG-like jellyroll fold domain-containing protein [Planctomycetota bacterium]
MHRLTTVLFALFLMLIVSSAGGFPSPLIMSDDDPFTADQTLDDEEEARDFLSILRTCNNIRYVVLWGGGGDGDGGCPKPEQISTNESGAYNPMVTGLLASQRVEGVDVASGGLMHFSALQDPSAFMATPNCSACGSGAASGNPSLMNMSVKQVIRPRDEIQGTSLAPGSAMSVLDTRLSFAPSGSGNRALLFDPADPSVQLLEDGVGNDGTLDGDYQDPSSILYKGLKLYDANDAVVSDLSQAVRAELTTKHDSLWGFELFDQASAEPQWLDDLERGRVISLNGNHEVQIDGYTGVLGSSPRTSAAWVRTADLEAGDGGIVCAWGFNFNGLRWTMRIDTVSDTQSVLRVEVQGGFIMGSTNLADGGWHHIAAVLPAGKSNVADVLLYVDGQLETISSSKPQSINTLNSRGVQWGNGLFDRPLKGDLDDARIYSRGLSAAEIATLASDGVVSSSGLEGRWLFDETGGTVANDASANNRDGTTVVADPEYVGRLTRVRDRNGYGIDLDYKTWTPAQINQSPSRQWQVDKMTDAYGRETSFSYSPTQVSGRWVIDQVTLPNLQVVDLSYANGKINQIDLPDGTSSTYDWSFNTGLNMVVLEIDDAAAPGTRRNKTLWMSTNLGDYRGEEDDPALFYNQASMITRAVINGTNELAYAHVPDTDSGTRVQGFNYMGAQRARYTYAQRQVRHLDAGWTLGAPSLSDNAFSTDFEDTYLHAEISIDGDDLRAGIPSRLIDEHGNVLTFEYNSENLPTKTTYQDATFEAWSYNTINQVTRYRDRLGRVTVNEYDANGNLTLRKVGLLEVGGADVQQAEYAEYAWSYYNGSEGPAVAGITGAADPQPVGLKKSQTDANGNTTHFVYNANNFLIAEIEPADRVGDARATTLYEYDTVGRLSKATDPLGRETGYAYDLRDRLTVVTYEDGSTDQTFYANELASGAGSLANLVVASKDRNGNYTQHRYDGHGRRVTTIRGITTETDALNQSFVPDPTYHDVEECTYLNGTNKKTVCIRNGERTEYQYDYRHRVVETTVYPRDNSGAFPFASNLIDPDGAGPLVAGDDPGHLARRTVYKDNLPFASVDPYGRATLHAYRTSDSARVRTIRETVPGGSGIDPDTGTFSDVINLTRDLSFEDAATLGATASGGGAPFLVTDMIKDAEGQTTSTMDPRNVQHDTVYDSRGRATESTTAVGTAVEAKTETVYDAQSNITQQRSARYFDAADTEGFNKAFTTMTYTGRNLLATRTVAAGDTTYDAFVTSGGTSGLGAKATQEMFYYLDGTHEKTVDFNGNDPQFTAADHETLSVWRDCCKRLRATIDQEGHGNAQGTDFNGNVAHTAVVDSLINDVVIDGATGARTIADSDDGGPGIWDAPDARTLAETTTRFDSKNRPAAMTIWLETLGKVDPNDPPILYGGSIQGGANAQAAATGVSTAAGGLTTLYYYSEDLYETPAVSVGVEGVPTRGPAQGNTILVHQFSGAPDIDLQPMLNELAADSIEVIRDGFTNASARATINPEGEIGVTIMDGAGRAVISAMLDPTNNSVVTWSTVSYDRVSDAIGTTFGDTLETLSISALDHLNRSLTDGAGRTVESEDAENNVAYAIYDNAGNAIRTRNANDVGDDCDFDPRGRLISCTDTQGDTTTAAYNDNNQVINRTDGKAVANAADTVYDARGRAIETTSRLAVADTNKASFDPNSNLLTQTDAQGGVTTYEYNPRNLRTATDMPGHNPTSVVGDADYDRVTTTFDAMRRPTEKTDQLGDTTTFAYDLASRLVTRTYRLNGAGTDESQDTFTFDDASRPLTAIKGRYSNTVAFAYDEIGRLETESLTTNGQTYTTTRAYDDDSRNVQLTYPDGSVVTQTYTARNQVEDLDYTPPGGSATTLASHTYDAGMRQTLRELGNGLDVTRAYRDDNLLESIDVATRPGLSMSYSYDQNKSMTAEDFDNAGVMDRYGVDLVQDAKDRMTSWTRDATMTSLDIQTWDLSFEHNWDSTTRTDGLTPITESRTHNPVHELLTLDPDDTGPITPIAKTHDSKGNLSNDGSGRAFAHDIDNMLSQVTVSPGAARGTVGTHSYTYDALNRRVSKTVNGTTTVFVCSGSQVIADYTGGTAASAPDRKYVFCSTCYIDEPIALIDATGPSEATYYYHRNRQYSVIGLTDGTGTVIERHAYTAYGDPAILAPDGVTVLTTSGFGNAYLHTGRRYDAESALYYYRARYYGPALGRFLERDPLGYVDGMNTYAAYHVMWGGVDPLGLAAKQYTRKDAVLADKSGGPWDEGVALIWHIKSTSWNPSTSLGAGPDGELAVVFPSEWSIDVTTSTEGDWPKHVKHSGTLTLVETGWERYSSEEDEEICWVECRKYTGAVAYGQSHSVEGLQDIIDITLKLTIGLIGLDPNIYESDHVDIDLNNSANINVDLAGDGVLEELEDLLRERINRKRVAGTISFAYRVCADGRSGEYARGEIKGTGLRGFEQFEWFSEGLHPSIEEQFPVEQVE